MFTFQAELSNNLAEKSQLFEVQKETTISGLPSYVTEWTAGLPFCHDILLSAELQPITIASQLGVRIRHQTLSQSRSSILNCVCEKYTAYQGRLSRAGSRVSGARGQTREKCHRPPGRAPPPPAERPPPPAERPPPPTGRPPC